MASTRSVSIINQSVWSKYLAKNYLNPNFMPSNPLSLVELYQCNYVKVIFISLIYISYSRYYKKEAD